jgi:hypothetical protein
MKRFSVLVTGALLALLIVTPVYAQQPGTTNDPHHPAPPSATPATPATPPPTSAQGSKGEEMAMMDMCRQMMGDMTAMPMSGGAASTDPKDRAEMLQMRGEMMRAMGDIMMKHARRMGKTGK